MDIGGEQSRLLLRLMSAATMRSQVLAANVANQNTPGYLRKDVEFEEALVRELARPRPNPDAVQARVVTGNAEDAGPDGNSVEMEVEVSAMRENRLLYELYASILEGRMHLLRLAVREGR